MDKSLNIIGGGMAGCEAAWQAANMGIDVTLYEMRPKVKTFAHQTEKLGEMVCSNSFRSNDHEQNAVGLLHWEMMLANGLIITTAYQNKLPAGGALAVDRVEFADSITRKINGHPKIRISNEEITKLPTEGRWIVATGPLTSSKLAKSIAELSGIDALAFFDAIAPIIYFDTIDMSKAWMQSRYDKGETEEERTAYLNCPMSKEQYNKFIFTTQKMSTNHYKNIYINKKNLLPTCIYLTARQLFNYTWLNDIDQFLYPTKKGYSAESKKSINEWIDKFDYEGEGIGILQKRVFWNHR